MNPIAIDAHSGPVSLVSFAPDGKSLVSAGDDGSLKEWSVHSWKMIGKYSGHTGRINGAVFSPHGDVLVSAAADGDLKWWQRQVDGDATDGTHADGAGADRAGADRAGADRGPVCIRTTKEVRRSVQSLFVTPDGRWLLVSTLSDVLIVVSMADGTVDRKIKSPARHVTALDLSRLGTRIAAGGAGETVYMYSIPDASLVTSVRTGSESVSGFVFCRDARRALSLGSDGVLRTWDSADWHATGSLQLEGGTPGRLAVSPNGARAAAAMGDRILIIDLDDLQIAQSLELSDGGAQIMAFSPDERMLAASTTDRFINVWELQ